MPPSEGGLAELIAMMEEGPVCPPPPAQFRPEPFTLTVTNVQVPQGLTVYTNFEMGILDQIGGGHCWRMRNAYAYEGEPSDWGEVFAPENCVALPEPGFVTGALLGALVVTALRRRRGSRRLRPASPSGPGSPRADSGASLGAALLRAPKDRPQKNRASAPSRDPSTGS